MPHNKGHTKVKGHFRAKPKKKKKKWKSKLKPIKEGRILEMFLLLTRKRRRKRNYSTPIFCTNFRTFFTTM